MDKEELTALKGSIATWKKRLNGEKIKEGFDNCPLCMLTAKRSTPEGAYYDYHDVDCTDCMVYKRTGKKGCEDTPYSDKFETVEEERIRAEIRFLESFLPIKVDDNVKCHDSNYAYRIAENGLKDVGNICNGKKYKVIAVDCKLPAHNVDKWEGVLQKEFNDTIIQNVDSGEFFFTQERFLTRITMAPRCNDCGKEL